MVLCCAPLALFAQSILRTAGDFTLLGNAAITSSGVAGTTISNGNVGLSPTATGAITGFPPAVIVNGAIIATGAQTAQAVADFNSAQTGLAAMTATSTLTGINLGGLTLSSGVYKFADAALLTGALTLDAQGQNGVAWVFQIGSTLTTADNASVMVINLGSNLGSDLGLFWNTGTAMTFGANNALLGNFLAGSSITYTGLNTSGSGRAIADAAISLNKTTLNAFGGPVGSDWTGGLAFMGDGTTIGLTAVPEPAAVLWIAPLAALGFALWRRKTRGTTTVPAVKV